MYVLKLTQIGDSIGAIFPKELLAQMRLGEGDKFYVTETPDGLRISAHDPEFEEQIRIGRELMKEHHAVLRELAK